MYMTNLGEPQSKGDCAGWERDPQSFSKRVAEHYVRTVLGKALSPTRGPYKVTNTAWGVAFPDNIVVYVTFAKLPELVAAAQWYPKPGGPSRFYTYSCTEKGDLVLTERKQP